MFDYGDTVKIKKNSPEKYCPEQLGAVCGIIPIDNKVLAEFYNEEFGSTVYTIEFGFNGYYEAAIPERYLEIFEEYNNFDNGGNDYD